MNSSSGPSSTTFTPGNSASESTFGGYAAAVRFGGRSASTPADPPPAATNANTQSATAASIGLMGAAPAGGMQLGVGGGTGLPGGAPQRRQLPLAGPGQGQAGMGGAAGIGLPGVGGATGMPGYAPGNLAGGSTGMGNLAPFFGGDQQLGQLPDQGSSSIPNSPSHQDQQGAQSPQAGGGQGQWGQSPLQAQL